MAQVGHKFLWLFTQCCGNQFRNVDGIASSLGCERGCTPKREIHSFLLSRIRCRQHRVAVDQIIREIVTKKKRGRAYPRFAAVPALHAWGRKKNLAHLAHGILRNRNRRKRYLEQLCSLNKKLHRTFDLVSHDMLGIEFARAKKFPQEWAHFVLVCPDTIGKSLYDLRRWLVLDKIAPDFSPDKLSAGRLFQQRVDNIVTLECSTSTHERLRTG